jgi:lon-related putative ATP-dependent protease
MNDSNDGESDDSSTKTCRLAAKDLRWRCNPSQFVFETTRDLPGLDGLLGQARADSAIEFGLGIQHEGYNLFVLGPPGSGKRTVMRKYLEARAAGEPRPSDWCYVNNFLDEDRPNALEVPAGQGRQFEQDMTQLVDDLQAAIPAALESEEHRRKIEQAEQQFQDEHGRSLDALAKEAHDRGLELIRTPSGIALAPVRNGQVISPDDFAKLSEQERTAIEQGVDELQPKLQAIVQRLPQTHKLVREQVRELNREAIRFAMEHLISVLKQKYASLPEVVAHLGDVEADVIQNADQFRPQIETIPGMPMTEPRGPSFDQYLVNLLVDNSETSGAPVVYEDYPYFHNLIGRVDHETHMGSLVTHFTLIKAGALHKANGGYLVVQARDVLTQLFSWDALKRALRSRQIQIESLGAAMSLISTVSLQPEPIPLRVKVVLLGDRLLYYLLQEFDPDFDELFKVAVDFSDETDRSEENCQLYARLLSSLANQYQTRPLHRDAIAAMIEQAARQVGDQEKLSTHMGSVADLIRESDHWAAVEQAGVITESHVKKAIDQQIYRSDRIRQQIFEEIRRGSLLVDLQGTKIGQVNGLSVLSLGRFSFGRPSRITATAGMGRGRVIDIEREVELGGAIHSKGVLILSSLLATRYAQDSPLSLSASLVFEQSYGPVDGDSASVAEYCALLSVLSGVPIRQGLAVTGSLNQHGQAQPIGGVNEKIEGFFDVCQSIGLTGDQGVLIPASNANHLMLRQDVVDAVSAGRFSVITYDDVDGAAAVLMGIDSGSRGSDGQYPQGSLSFLVERRLRDFAERQRSFGERNERGEK